MRPTVTVGVADHWGWAVLVAVDAEGALVDRRRVELVGAGLSKYPHHVDGQKLPLKAAVQLVATVKRSARAEAKARLEELGAELNVNALALRALPTLPATVEARLSDTRAKNVADSVMYREALAAAAQSLGIRVHWYEEKKLKADARSPGRPWTKDHRVAMAAALSARTAAAR
jgi:hypothetical protein